MNQARKANVILRLAKGGSDVLPMKKKLSQFGRTYYEGISVQSVHRTLREGMLGISNSEKPIFIL